MKRLPETLRFHRILEANRFRNQYVLAVALALFSLQVQAQDSLSVSFEGLTPGQPLGEQFAAQGIHFRQVPGYSATTTVTSPPPLDSAGHTVAGDGSFWITFDTPIVSFHGLVAQRFISAGSSPNWQIIPLDSQGHFLPNGDNGFFPADQWSPMQANFHTGDIVQGVWLRGYRFDTENNPSSLLLNSFGVTFIPEPGTCAFLLAGSSALLFFKFRPKQRQY